MEGSEDPQEGLMNQPATTKEDIMIYEVRTYMLKTGTVAECEKRFAEAVPPPEKYSPLGAFWHTELGPLNQIIHVWPYENLQQRTEISAQAAKDPHWPPKI